MIEAEYKARLIDPSTIRALLFNRAEPERVSYFDMYFDNSDKSLTRTDHEFRLRTISGPEGVKHLLTFKDPAVDDSTGSKPEYETLINDREPIEQIITRLGYEPVISFSKHCENYRFAAKGRQILATLVNVPEINGIFLELETHATDEDDLASALADLRTVLAELNVSSDQLTTELYTDAVARSRA